MAFCLTAGTVVATLAVQSLTLTWIHSVEKAEIQEDYSLTNNRLLLTEARIKTSGAGFDPPPGAVLDGGWWRWQPGTVLETVMLARSAAPGEWRICVHNLLPTAQPISAGWRRSWTGADSFGLPDQNLGYDSPGNACLPPLLPSKK